MTDRELEARLARAMADAAPDRLDDLLRVREGRRAPEGGGDNVTDIGEARGRKRRSWRTLAAATAAALVLVLGGGGIFGWRYANAPDSLVAIDVNPSVQLTVSRNEKVLEAEALNADGAEIIDDMDLRGSGLNVAVNALIGSMVQHGYIDELRNSVLITVENSDEGKARALQDSLMADVEGLLAGNAVDAAVVGQTITTKDQELETLAAENNISEGKAALIQRIMAVDPTLKFETLAGLSITDLNLLAESKRADVTDMAVTGKASDKAYIGLERAGEIARAQLPGATLKKVEFDYDDGMVYEAELLLDGYEYELEIDAVTGAVLKWDWEVDDDAPPPVSPSPSPKPVPGETAGPAPSTPPSVAPQPLPSPSTPTETPMPSPSERQYITEEAARALVLAEIPGAEFTEFKFERDDGRRIYKGEAVLERTEYEFKIDAATGEFIKWESERMDEDDWREHQEKQVGGPKDPSPSEYVGKKGAEDIVLAQLPGAQVGKIKLDKDDGRAVYEGKAWLDGWEYEFEIDAVSGEILDWDSEPMDD